MNPNHQPDTSPTHPFGKRYNWSQKQLIYQGPFASCYKLFNLQRNVIECVKVVNTEMYILEEIKRYIDHQSELQTQYLLKPQTHLFQDQLYIRMPIFQESLKEMLQKSPATPATILTFIQKIISIMNNSENQTIVHGNLKPSNILIKNKEYHLTDYGFHHLYAQKQSELIGLGIYTAPQFVINHKITPKSDVWSFGLIIYEMVFGYLPWVNRNLKSYKSQILKYPLSFPYDTVIGEKLKDFIQRCLVLDEHKRMSWEKAAEHPLVLEGKLGNLVPVFQLEKNQNIAVGYLLKLQGESRRKSKSVKRIIETVENRPFNLEFFKKVCLELDGGMLDDEIVLLYQTFKMNEGCCSWGFLKKILLEIDFRPKNNAVSRFMRELSEMAIHLSISPHQLPTLLNQDSSQLPHFQNFLNAISTLLPQMPYHDILHTFNLFPSPTSSPPTTSLIKDIQSQLLKKPSKTEREKINTELQDFRESFKEYGNVTIHEMIRFFDKNGDKMIGFGEFKNMVSSLWKYVSDDDLKVMFDDIDSDHSGKITGEEIKEFLRSR